MANGQNEKKNKDEGIAPEPDQQKTVRKVVVTHLDEPPPSGKKTIHPRRLAPIVPTREERTGEQPVKDTNPDKPSSE